MCRADTDPRSLWGWPGAAPLPRCTPQGCCAEMSLLASRKGPAQAGKDKSFSVTEIFAEQPGQKSAPRHEGSPFARGCGGSRQLSVAPRPTPLGASFCSCPLLLTEETEDKHTIARHLMHDITRTALYSSYLNMYNLAFDLLNFCFVLKKTLLMHLQLCARAASQPPPGQHEAELFHPRLHPETWLQNPAGPAAPLDSLPAFPCPLSWEAVPAARSFSIPKYPLLLGLLPSLNLSSTCSWHWLTL